MEQQVDLTHLRPGPVAKASAVAIGACGIGVGILLATWGLSYIWRPINHPIEVKISNPEVRVIQSDPFIVKQGGPFVVKQEQPFEVAAGTLKFEPTPAIPPVAKTADGDIIQREVTVFSTVPHGLGSVVTGWKYANGSGGIPSSQYCYYTAPNADGSSFKVDLAVDQKTLSEAVSSRVPDLNLAIARCQWWQT